MVAGFVDGVLLASDAGHVDHAHVGANLRGTETPMQSNARTVDAILNRAFAEVRGQRSTSAG